MALMMIRPTKHPKTGIYRLRKGVPARLREAAGKREWIVNLHTKDPAEARRRAPSGLAEIEAMHAAAIAASQPTRRLTQMEVMAECGVWYRAMLTYHEEDPGSDEGWETWAGLIRDRIDTDAGGEIVDFTPLKGEIEEARRILLERGVPADMESTLRFAVALHLTKFRLTATLKVRAKGDYSPDLTLATFPAATDRKEAEAKPQPTLPAEDVVKAWAAERNPSAATLTKYLRTFRHLADILGFDDVRRITPEDVVKFKQARSAAKIGAGTIADDVLGAGTVCKWATANMMIASNSFAGLAPKALRRGPAPRDGYSDDEAKRILNAARNETGWLRWAPWLQAFSGARVSEFTDMRRGDVRQEAGVWIFDVKALVVREGKNDTFQRMIPIHPAIIADGFLDYVDALPRGSSGPLFPSLSPAPNGSRIVPGTSKMARWIRGEKVGITDPKKAPNHSWRHRIEDELRKVRALPEVQDAITGRHNPRNAGDGYGKGFRGMPEEVLVDLGKIPSPIPPQ